MRSTDKLDTIIAVCLQNDFLDERPADGSYALGAKTSYDIPEEDVHESTVRRGALAVGRSEEVVPVANEWMRRMDEAGGTVIATLDWHPPDHCSFCRFGKNSSKRLDCVWGCNGTQGICVTGAGVPPRCSTARPVAWTPSPILTSSRVGTSSGPRTASWTPSAPSLTPTSVSPPAR